MLRSYRLATLALWIDVQLVGSLCMLVKVISVIEMKIESKSSYKVPAALGTWPTLGAGI